MYNGEVQLQPKNLIFPSAINEDTVVNTSGLVNYLYDFVETNLLTDYQDYKANLKSIGAQIGFKIRGYSKKENGLPPSPLNCHFFLGATQVPPMLRNWRITEFHSTVLPIFRR